MALVPEKWRPTAVEAVSTEASSPTPGAPTETVTATSTIAAVTNTATADAGAADAGAADAAAITPPAASTPSAEATPIPTLTLTPEPTATATQTTSLSVLSDFCNAEKTDQDWLLSADPAPAPALERNAENQCVLTFPAGQRASILLNAPVEIKVGTEIEFSLQLSDDSSNPGMVMGWYAGDAVPDPNTDGSIAVKLGYGWIKALIISDARNSKASSEKLMEPPFAHIYKIVIDDGSMMNMYQDEKLLLSIKEPINLNNTQGRLIFFGEGTLRSIKISVP